MQDRIHRVEITERAQTELRRLIEENGPVLFHQSAGHHPVCLPTREFHADTADVLLGRLSWHTEFWISATEYEQRKDTQLTVDVDLTAHTADRTGNSTAELPDDQRFVLRTRALTADEAAALAAAPPPRTGADQLR